MQQSRKAENIIGAGNILKLINRKEILNNLKTLLKSLKVVCKTGEQGRKRNNKFKRFYYLLATFINKLIIKNNNSICNLYFSIGKELL